MRDFLENIVNQRFKEVFDLLVANKIVKGKSDLALKLDTYNHVINNILNGKRSVTIHQLNKLFSIYNVNANYIFGQSDTIFTDSPQLEMIPVRHMQERTFEGKMNIKFIQDRRAFAGTALDLTSTADTMQRFSVPNLDGDLYAIEIEGDSMMPTITNGDLVVCESVERGDPLRDNQVYVIVTDVIVAKRVQQIKENNEIISLRLISDNEQMYKPYTVSLDEVRKIMRVKCRITASGMR